MNEQPQFSFSGQTYEPQHDAVRLTGQCLDVFRVMEGGAWLTLEDIQIALVGEPHYRRASEASISARIRDFRKGSKGSHTVERRRRGNDSAGIHEYRLTVNRTAMDADLPTAFQR